MTDVIDMINSIEKDKLDYFINNLDSINGIKKEYLNLYFIDDIFGKIEDKYVDFLEKVKTNNDILNLVKYINNENLETFMVNLFNNINNVELFEIISKSDFIYIVFDYNYEDVDDDFFINAFVNYIIENKNNYAHLKKKFNETMLFIIKNKKLRNKVINYYVNFYNLNKQVNNIIPYNKFNQENVASVIICESLLYIWDNGINFDKLQNKIDINYVYSENCRLNYVDKPNNNETYNFLTQGMFIINKQIEVSLINILNKQSFLLRDINYVKEKLKTIEDVSQEYIYVNFLNKLTETYDDITKFIDNNIDLEKYDIFYDNIIYYIVKNIHLFEEKNTIILDNLLSNYLFIKKQIKYINFDNIFQDLFINIFSKNITNNNYHKLKILELIEISFDKNNVNLDIFINNNIYVLTNILFDTYNIFENCFEENSYKIEGQSIVSSILMRAYMKMSLDDDIKTNILLIKNNESLKTNKFINNFISNIHSHFEKLLEFVKDGNNNKKLYLSLYSELMFNMCLLEKFCYIITDSFLQIGIKEKFCNLINFIIYGFGKYKDDFEDYDNSNRGNIVANETFCSIYIFYKLITNLLLIFKNKNLFIKLIVENEQYFHLEYYKNLIDNDIYENLDFIKKIEETYKKYVEENENDTEIPDEFLDPIMNTFIKNPVFLPNCDTIMDKDVIVRHLLSNEYNPFNREKLTIKLLEQYNNQEHIIEKINIFKEKIKHYIK